MVATLLAQWMLRPIHVIQSGLTRLGRGELDVRLDLPGQEFADLGSSFEAVSAQLSAVRNNALPATSTSTEFESVMENLEDAVALFSPEGELMFSNAAMRALLPGLTQQAGSAKPSLSLLADNDPIRQLVERALAGRKSAGPVAVPLGRRPKRIRKRRSTSCSATRSTMRRGSSSARWSWRGTWCT